MQSVDDLERTRQRLRATARAQMGFTGDEDTEPLREVVERSGVGWYPMFALGLLVIIDEFQGYAFFVLGPEISRALGISKTMLAGLVSLKTLAIMLAALPMAALVQRRARRGLVSIVTAFAWSVFTLLTGFVRTGLGLTGVLLADGASTGSVRAIHPPLLIDSYPPDVRVRALSAYRAADSVGNVLAPLTVAVLTAWLAFTWRGVFLVMGVISLLATIASLGLRDPGFGRWDTARVRRSVSHGDEKLTAAPEQEEELRLGFFEIVRRLWLIPTIRRIFVAFAVLGMLLIPLNTLLFFFLEERWNMGPGARGLFLAGMAIFGIIGLAAFGRHGESVFRRDPANLPRLSAWILAVGIVALVLALAMPVFVIMVLLFGVAFAMFAILAPATTAMMHSIISARMRPHAAALAGVMLAGVGGFGGLLLLGGVESRFGTTIAIASIAVPGLIAAAVLHSADRTMNDDLDRMVGEIIEDEEIRVALVSGARLPLLSCRNVDFSYGQVQVLFNVDFTVDDGEMVALLGTNGAGKSTLLRVISGLGLPTAGSVRLRGQDVTYLDAERRLHLGIVQIPGGRAVFDPLTVTDNLRAISYTLGRDAGAVERAIETSFEAFPSLAARRNQPASTLSGGEKQMLGLAKAFILKPRLLLIDEVSLGLAPKIVTELLEMIRRINKQGTAVVLVEQSVNIALSVVDHAYFMEKGQIRFDGSAADLLERPDLVRSVFLEGAARGIGS